jgi:hypothetical protein
LRAAKVGLVVRVRRSVPVSGPVAGEIRINGAGVLEETLGVNVSTRISSNRCRTSESVDSVGEGINSVSVVEGLSTENLEKESIASQGRAVVNVLVGLDDPDKLLNGVVKVKLNLVTGRTDRLITGELELSNQVLVGVLCHSATFISVQEHVVNVQGSSNQRLIVSNSGGNGATNSVLTGSCRIRVGVAVQGGNSPQALINRADIKVNLDFVVLKSNQGESETGVGTEPKLKRNVQSGLRKSVTGSANLTGGQGVARRFNIRERRVSDEGELSGVTNHIPVSTELLGSHSKLVPDVHPVTILTVDSLTTNFDLNLSDKLLTGVVQPTGINTSVLAGSVVSETHKLVNLRKSHL